MHRNLERLQRGLAAFASHDLGALREIFSEDVIWHWAGSSVLAGVYVGFEEMSEMFARRAALSADTYAVHLEQSIVNDDFITVFMRATAQRDGKTLAQTICYVYRLSKDKVVEAWGLPSDPEAERAFWE